MDKNNGGLAFPSEHALRAMERRGGDFAKALADAYRAADPKNQQRLAVAFPDYFERYEHVAQQMNIEE